MIVTPTQTILTADIARHFLGAFRSARFEALQDAEGYQELLFCVERLGTALSGKVSALGSYQGSIAKIADLSPLAEEIPGQWRELHIPFARLYELVREARNDALHHGALARNLTTSAVQLALVLEDAFMTQLSQVADYMVRGPVCAQLWHPISFMRQQMLEASFSYLPFFLETGKKGSWYLIADRSIAKYLSTGGRRKERLARPLKDAIEDGLKVEEALTCSPEDDIQTALDRFTGSPILVCRRDAPDELIGILTAFDLL